MPPPPFDIFFFPVLVPTIAILMFLLIRFRRAPIAWRWAEGAWNSDDDDDHSSYEDDEDGDEGGDSGEDDNDATPQLTPDESDQDIDDDAYGHLLETVFRAVAALREQGSSGRLGVNE